MGETGTRQRDSRPPRTGGPAFDLVVSKPRRPLVRPGTVRRSRLIEWLTRGDPRPVVSVVAPAGYGKTTLLSQWAASGGQAFAWVSGGRAEPTCLPQRGWPKPNRRSRRLFRHCAWM